MLTGTERKVLIHISSNEPAISKRPFLDAAHALDMKEEDLIDILQSLQGKGIIRRFRAVINHIKAGYNENALIAWRVSPGDIDAVKNVFIDNGLISHCYERKPHREFNYNIFIMMHAKERRQIERFAGKVARDFSVDYVLLFTEEELKREKLDLAGLLCSSRF